MKEPIFLCPFQGISQWVNISKLKFIQSNKSTSLLKSYLALVFIFQFFTSTPFAQNFFPLKVGNVYQIEDDWWWAGPGNTGESGTDYYFFSVIQDTIINNELFFTLSSNYGNRPFNREHFFRYDSITQKLFVIIPGDTTTRLAVDYNLPAGINYTSYITGEALQFLSEGISSQVVMGDTLFVYSMYKSSIPSHRFQFADNIGFCKFYSYWTNGINAGGATTQTIISAIIDSVLYNPLELGIDTLYPIFDRPVDTFPYLLTIPYSASYSELVDSFYLDAEQFRSDTLVQTKIFNISTSNPRVSFYLSGLLSGDKIKLRATITDTSIFYNVAHYPDTGWVVVNVLPPILNVENENTPLSYELAQNYPNPFNPTTRIRYQIPEPVLVIIKVFDVLGNEIETPLKEEKIAGSYELEFNGSGLTSGIYYYRITAGAFSQTKKMILLK